MPSATSCGKCGTPLPTSGDTKRCGACGKWMGPTEVGNGFPHELAAPPASRPHLDAIPVGVLGNATPDLFARIASQSHFEDRYELRGELARGGMGVIHRAYDRVLRRPVAIKMRKQRLGGGDDLALRGQFLREARVGGRLLHPNVIPVFDLGVNQVGQIYYTMRLVDGVSLKACLDALSSGVATKFIDFPLCRVVEAFVGICRGVDYAHDNRILHLDLKPQNVLVSGFSEVFVIDWGLAREEGAEDEDNVPHIYQGAVQAESDAGTQVGGGGIGTPEYMAPEQRTGDPARYSPATDVYALGGILRFILCGEPPNVGGAGVHPNPPLRPGIVPKGRQLPKEHRVAVAELSAVCLRALESAPSNRYADVDEMIAELTHWLVRSRTILPA